MKPPVFDPSWSDELKALYRHDMQEIWDRTINPHIWNQYQNQLDIYRALAGDVAIDGVKRILDVGCAQGTLALLLAEAGHSVVALDLRAPFLDYAKSRYVSGDISFLAANVLDVDIGEQFDLVYANQIIEHLVYPGLLVGQLKNLLKPSGRLVVTTPNWHYLRNGLPTFESIGDPSRHEHRQFTADADGHFFAYRASELKRVFEEQGFHAIETHYFESPFVSGHLKFRHLVHFAPQSALKALDRIALASPFGRNLAHQLMVIGWK